MRFWLSAQPLQLRRQVLQPEPEKEGRPTAFAAKREERTATGVPTAVKEERGRRKKKSDRKRINETVYIYIIHVHVSSFPVGADSSAVSNGLPSLRSQTLSLHCSRFCCSRSAEERGAAAEDGQASGGMIKREFCHHEKLACWRTLLQPHHSCCYRRPRRG